MALTTAVTIAGNLANDPELRHTQEGKAVVNVTVVANPRTFNRSTKEWEDGEAVFQKGTAWGELAEHIAHSLSKGDRVIAYGTLKAESWTDREGVKRGDKVLQIDDIGASLQFANARVEKGRAASKSADRQDTDNWATPTQSVDETPF